MMDEANFIVREPVLDPKGKTLGYGLKCQDTDTAQDDPNALVYFVTDQLNDEDAGWRLRDTKLFLEVAPASLAPEAVAVLPPGNTVFTLNSAALAEPETLAAVQALREQGFGISLKHVDLVAQNKAFIPHLTLIEMHYGGADFARQAKVVGAISSSLRIVVHEVGSWQDYDACAAQGFDAFIGSLYLTSRPGTTAKGLNPAQTMILQLMQLVRQNADVRKLEDILRRDAALSYKLLRYINSVGFGLGAEIQSLRHAVTMLGYSPLYRWLSLLLATAGGAGTSPVLMQTAVIRGRLVELLGEGYVPKGEAENLFVTGMFSLLDRLLGQSMEEVLENIQLSDAVSEALLSRTGMYGPFLALAEACEANNGNVRELADALFLDSKHVNEAHLAALVWAQSLAI